MHRRNLPDWLEGFMLLTEESEPPVLYRKWSAISAIASALQRKTKISLGISLTVYPNFYIVLVGPSATGKGTAMKFAYDIISQIPNIKLTAQATSRQALIRRMKEVNLTDTDLETSKQLYHSSITVFSNEFTVFLGYQERELIANLCDWYDCHNVWTYDTISRDREKIVGCWVNIIGGTTPENIQESLPEKAIGSGLTSRIIFVNEDKRSKVVVFHSAAQRELELQQHLIHDLEAINLMTGTFNFSSDAIDYYTSWCYEAASNPPFHDTKFDGYCGRRRNHLLSLSMVCSASRDNELVVLKDDLERADVLLKEVEVKMGTVFRGMGKSNIAALINDTIIFMENSFIREIPMWQFARRFEGQMDKFTMDRVLDTLAASRYIEVIKIPGQGETIKILDRPKIERTNQASQAISEDDQPHSENSQ